MIQVLDKSHLLDRSGKLALDARGLDSLRLQAKQDPEQAAKGAAQQFEAVFLQTMLKSMRDATPQDGPTDSEQTRMYTSMLDQQLAQSLSAKGIGLADVMLRQLKRNSAPVASTGPATLPVDAKANAKLNADAGAVAQRPAGVVREVQPPAVGVKIAAPPVDRDFFTRLKEHALAASNTTGIPARFLLGHAALESGWGKHEIRGSDGSNSFNLFGIKAGRNWKGPSVEVMTTEFVDGAPRKLLQKFRAYDSYADAFRDYASLMKGNPRYAGVLKQNDSAAFAQGLQRAGYATDPQYADKLTRVLNGSRLRQTFVA